MAVLLRELFSVILLVQVVYCQDACKRITKDVLGNSSELVNTGLVADIITPPGIQTLVRIVDMNIVCEAQHMMEDRYRYTSVVVSFNCFTSDPRLPECHNSSVVITEQFDLGCNGGAWTASILSVDNQARTSNPTANLTTELDTCCILCLNPVHPSAVTFSVSTVTHCASKCNS